MLSCSCAFEECDWYYHHPDNFTTADWKRRKRCCSCNKLIDIGSSVVRFHRIRHPYNDIEERIWGDEVELSSWYMCDWCGEMYFNLDSLGYCHYLGDSMQEAMEDYWDITGFSPPHGEGV